jgi:hypothetical protein
MHLWPCANPDTWAKEGRSVYVNKAYDMFFFGDMACGGPHELWFLHTIVNKSTRESKNADDNARARFLHDINRIEHFALSWEIWLRCLGPYPLWLQKLPQLKALTVILSHVHGFSSEVIPKFRNITPGTVRARCAGYILRLMEGDLDASYKSCWRIRVPQLNALAAVGFDDDDENSEDDLWYLKHLEFERFWIRVWRFKLVRMGLVER